jgi:ABC-type branched-subunit amino acid transport system substrate-binding protein
LVGRVFTVVAALLVAAGAAGAAPRATPGVTSTTITLGGSAPFTGEASAAGGVARGADAYFKWVNAHGGVRGRKVVYKILDDAYDPARTVQNTRELVQQDQVFAMFNVIGTNPNLAIRQFLNQLGVPQIFAASGATTFGTDYKQYPWTIGYIPSYQAEGKIYGRYITKTLPTAKVAILYQDDAYGKDLVTGLKKVIRPSKIVASQAYDPTSADVRSQMAKLKASKATVLCVFAFGKFAVQAYYSLNSLGWHPKVFVNDVASAASLMKLSPGKVTEGSISIVFGKDPSSPQWKRDKGMKLYRSVMAKYYADGISNSYAAAGAGAAYTMVDVLRKAGKNLTREGLMRAATHLTERGNPFVLPGIVIRTTSRNHFPIAQVKLQRWHKGHWVIFGKLISAKP